MNNYPDNEMNIKYIVAFNRE